ncbi:MAG: alpha/beta fold hydrolase [Gammaproteobacteria bacterium]|nr:alpha/beta fold hydrolase [Gammaproteobacteria bacterium]
MNVILYVLLALVLAAVALYYLVPGVVLAGALALARRAGRLRVDAVSVDGHRVPYLEGGRGEPLLLLHGFGANKDNWVPIAPHLTRHCHVYAPDLPGFGDSTRRPEASYGLDAQLERIAAFADALGLDRFHLGGNSMGGYLAAMFAARHPERVASLWLLAPAGAMGAETSETLALIERGDNPLVTDTMAQFERLAALCFTRQPYLPAQFKRPLLARARREAAFNHKIFADIFGDPVPLEGRIDGLATRTLVAWGDDDRVLHPSGLDVVAGLLPKAERILMPRMGHVPMIERPAETAADYLRFRGLAG